ncbi:TetR/AcrR family transcriptional regulator [Novosphingobium bradum]|uniref:TetR/AcrR family transcriptional regulator n=1 Tax=Novosphingobium bradum TaxID=1737444 RepID=A0ABV7IPG2_9SPHN
MGTVGEMTKTEAPRRRRPRRSQAEILEKIRAAALQLFADRGYAGTTTQEIARVADVSETLLFRHFGSKANLYDAAVSAPFEDIIHRFVEERQKVMDNAATARDPKHMSGELFDFFDQHREVFTALALVNPNGDDQESVPLAGLERTFEQAAREILASYTARGEKPPFDADIAVRLAFGMVAASVILRPLLFSGSGASKDAVRETIMTMISQSLWQG